MTNELEHYGVKGMKWGERKDERPMKSFLTSRSSTKTPVISKVSETTTKRSETREKSISTNRVRQVTKPIRKTSSFSGKASSDKSSSSRQKSFSNGRVRESGILSKSQSSPSSWKSSSTRQKDAPTEPYAVHYPDNLEGRSLLDTKIKDTPKWLEDNGHTMTVDDALDAVKKILPERRSSGTDIANALKNINSQGGSLLTR